MNSHLKTIVIWLVVIAAVVIGYKIFDSANTQSQQMEASLFYEYLADDQPPWGVAAGTVELEDMQLNQLKALGYRIDN